MTRVARFFVWLFTLAVPVVIAACYGPPARYARGGKVVDAATKQGLQGIDVTCMHGAERGWGVRTYDPSGAFTLYYDVPCSAIVLEDAVKTEPSDAGNPYDRTATYKTRTIEPYVEGTDDLVLEMEAE